MLKRGIWGENNPEEEKNVPALDHIGRPVLSGERFRRSMLAEGVTWGRKTGGIC